MKNGLYGRWFGWEMKEIWQFEDWGRESTIEGRNRENTATEGSHLLGETFGNRLQGLVIDYQNKHPTGKRLHGHCNQLQEGCSCVIDYTEW